MPTRAQPGIRSTPRQRPITNAPPRRITATLAACLCMALLGTPVATAQVSTMATTYFPESGAAGPQLTRSDMEVFVRVLELGDTEQQMLEALYDAFYTEWQQGHRAMRREASDLIERAEILQDQRLLDKVWPMRQEWTERATQLERRFLDDVTTMLTAEQEGRWPIVERELRRIKKMGAGRLAGESVDIVRLVARIVPDDAMTSEIKELLEQYAEQLDAALVRRERLLEDESDGFADLVKSDPDRAEEVYFRAVRARTAICDVNERFARQIAAALPEDIAENIMNAFREDAYAMYIKPTRIEKQILAAETATGLSPDQVERTTALLQRYRAEVRQMNQKEIDIRLSLEREETPEFIRKARSPEPESPEGNWRQHMGWGEDHPLSKLRAERLELDRRHRDELKEILTEQQYLALPDTAGGSIFFYGYGLDYPRL
ncbi:MAG: hypothetical protein ACTS3F_14440 [Phycisphaerales bacterium]